ncbi:MAG: hypothetical protein H6601_01875 [Flavobacteriales bacterium]|nr:hypothetical protein [Flavobacteriales bacterium]
MKSRSTTLFISLFFVLILGSSSCDLINPEEKIPAFIRIDSISVNSAGHGNNVNDIVDAWVFDNEQLVGVYELPAVVPILHSGDVNIRIRPGVKLNGQAASRWKYEFLQDFLGTVELFEDSVINLNPTLPYKDGAITAWNEDFEVSSQQSLTITTMSEAGVVIVTGAEAYDTKSAKLSLPLNLNFFECKANQSFDLPSGGASVILEFSYKGNFPFVVSVISTSPGGSVQTPILQVNASDEWKHIYISLTDIATNYFTAEHTPVFGYIRNEDAPDEISVYLDNIKLTHF